MQNSIWRKIETQKASDSVVLDRDLADNDEEGSIYRCVRQKSLDQLVEGGSTID
jgi:hypothetical protein